MPKKLTLLGMVSAALAALVVPAMASASPELKNATSGLKVPVGSKLMATSSRAVIMRETKFGTLTCREVSLGAELTNDSGTAIEAAGKEPATSSGSGCTTSSGPTIVMDEPKLVSLATNSTTVDEGTLSMSFKTTVGTGPTECAYSGSGPFTYKTGTGNDLLTVSEGNPILLTGPGVCEKESKQTKLSGVFTLEQDTSGGGGTGPFDPVFVG